MKKERLLELAGITEAKYASQKLWVVNAFDPEEGLLEVYAGPFTSEDEANNFAKSLSTTIKQMFEQAGGHDEFGKYYLDDLPIFSVIEIDNPDVFKNEILSDIRSKFGV
jgi:hypothetical protein